MASAPSATPADMMPKEKLIEILVNMLLKKGPGMVAELERRASLGQGLEARGIKADADTLKEALEEYDARQVVVVGEGATEINSPQRNKTEAPASPPNKDVLGGKPSSPTKAGTRWVPPGHAAPSGSSGARWMPGAPSASLLAAKAVMECEKADAFNRWVQVVRNVKVGVLARPDMQAEMTGTLLTEGEKFEVVARFLSQRDGRVYVRLKREAGWVSTRSRNDMTKVVLGPLDGETPIEPARYSQPIESTAMRLVPKLDKSAMHEEVNLAEAEDLDADDDELDLKDAMDDGVEDDEAMPEEAEEGDDDAEAAEEEEAEEEENEEDKENKDTGEEKHEEDKGADDGSVLAGKRKREGDADGKADSSVASPTKVRHHYHKFKVVMGRCPILCKPDAEELMALGKNRVLQLKQEINSDGYIFVPSEQRTYLRLTRNRGWVCEQSRNDIRKAAVVPARSKRQISKKMARAVAFRGGDACGHTKLGKDDLVKNKHGKVVSKKASEAARKKFKDNSGISRWTAAVKKAREELNLKGFVAVKKGTAVYEKAQEILRNDKAKT